MDANVKSEITEEEIEVNIVELLDDLDIVAACNCHHPMVEDERA